MPVIRCVPGKTNTNHFQENYILSLLELVLKETEMSNSDNEPMNGVFRNNAKLYAEKGYDVFPVYEKCKHVLQNGCMGATTDPDIIAVWEQKHSNANIGIKAGDHVLVLDIDNKGGKNGSNDLAEIEAVLGKLPPCPTVHTPTGGEHRYFVKPDTDVIGTVGVKWNGEKTGIDIRVGNQYVLAPPSIHPETKKTYSWQNPLLHRDEFCPNYHRLGKSNFFL